MVSTALKLPANAHALTTRAVRRIVLVLTLLDRAGDTLDDIAELRRSTQFIANSLSGLADSAEGINNHARDIAAEIEGLASSAHGIDRHAETITATLPAVSRLVDIIDPLENSLARFAHVVDQLPHRRRPRQHRSP